MKSADSKQLFMKSADSITVTALHASWPVASQLSR